VNAVVRANVREALAADDQQKPLCSTRASGAQATGCTRDLPVVVTGLAVAIVRSESADPTDPATELDDKRKSSLARHLDHYRWEGQTACG
jgi:hypothetical protein